MLVRLDSLNFGVVYVRSADIRVIGKVSENTVNIGVVVGGQTGMDVQVKGEVDEVAASLESLDDTFSIVRLT